MRDVDVATGHLRQQDVATGGDGLGDTRNTAQAQRGRNRPLVRNAVALQGLVLAVLDHRHVEHAGVLKRAPRQQRRRDRQAIVSHGHATGFFQLGDVGEFFALLPTRDRTDGIDPGQVRLGRLLQDQPGDTSVVVDRLGVRHARDGSKAAGHRRCHAGRDGLLVLLSRLAQVHVHVNQARTHHQSRRNVDDFGAIGVQVGTDFGNAVAINQHIEHAVASVGRVDDAAALEQAFHKCVGSMCGVRRPSGKNLVMDTSSRAHGPALKRRDEYGIVMGGVTREHFFAAGPGR